MTPAKLSTAITVVFGPVLDTAGAPYTGAIAYTDAKIFKNGTDGALNGSATFTHKYQGFYALALTTSDISAVGTATVTLNLANYSAPAVRLTVLPANVYDSLVAGSDALDVSLIQWLGTAPLALSSQMVQSIVPDTQKVDVNTIKTQTITCGAGVTIAPYVGNATAALSVDTNGKVTLTPETIQDTRNAVIRGVM